MSACACFVGNACLWAMSAMRAWAMCEMWAMGKCVQCVPNGHRAQRSRDARNVGNEAKRS